MPEQVHQRRPDVTEEIPAVDLPHADRVDADKLKSDLDSILDEIDDVLEKNAAEFVQNYVQKGGQ